MMYGMDIDLRSKIESACFLPLKVDSIDWSDSYHRIEISNSSIGYGAAIGPGVCISQVVILPLEYVHGNVIHDHWGRYWCTKLWLAPSLPS
jgi:hypothetical protein